MISIFPYPEFGITVTPFVILALAMILDAVFGDMDRLFRRIPHPVVIVGKTIEYLERRLNNPEDNAGRQKRFGIAMAFGLCAVALAIGSLLQAFCASVPGGLIIEVFIVGVLLAARSLFTHTRAVEAALSDGHLASARTAVSHLVGRDPSALDRPGVARAAIESLNENFSDGVVAPALWYLAFGLPGLLVFKTASTLDSMVGYRSVRYQHFGWASARLDDLMNWIPARMSAVLLVAAAALTPGFSWSAVKEGLTTTLRDHKRHASPNAGWPEAAAAGILGLKLGGPRTYIGQRPTDAPWMGDGRTEASAADISRALEVFRGACVLLGLGALVAATLFDIF